MGFSHSNPLSLATCITLLGKKDSKKLCNNTYLMNKSQDKYFEFAVLLHSTRIMTLSRSLLTINTGGFHTKTTKERLSWFLPCGFSIFSERGVWYLVYSSLTDGGFYSNPNAYRILAKIESTPLAIPLVKNTSLEDALPKNLSHYPSWDTWQTERKANVKETRALLRKVKLFIAEYLKRLYAGEILPPKKNDISCYSAKELLENFDYSPHLLLKATESGVSQYVRDTVYLWQNGQSISDNWQLENILYRYMKRDLGLQS